MVRTKVEIKRIEDKAKRHTTFTKRRQGLFKKTKELCKRCNAEAAVITFSLAGNVFAFGHPSVDDVVNRYKIAKSAPDDSEVDAEIEKKDDGKDNVVVEKNVDEEEEDEDEDEDASLFEMPFDEMGMEEVEEWKLAMEDLKKKVVERINRLTSNSKDG